MPGSEGDFVVLSGHAPVMASLRPGVVAIKDLHGKRTRIFVRGGFADVGPDGLIVLAETATPPAELDRPRISTRKSRTPKKTSPTPPTTRSASPRKSSTACANSATR